MQTPKQLTAPNINQLTTRDRFYAQRSYRQIQSRLKKNQPVDKLVEKYQANLKKSAVVASCSSKI